MILKQDENFSDTMDYYVEVEQGLRAIYPLCFACAEAYKGKRYGAKCCTDKCHELGTVRSNGILVCGSHAESAGPKPPHLPRAVRGGGTGRGNSKTSRATLHGKALQCEPKTYVTPNMPRNASNTDGRSLRRSSVPTRTWRNPPKRVCLLREILRKIRAKLLRRAKATGRTGYRPPRHGMEGNAAQDHLPLPLPTGVSNLRNAHRGGREKDRRLGRP